MIKDFSNPHGEIIPDTTLALPSGIQAFKIVREHGLFQLMKEQEGKFVPCEILNMNGHYLPAIFQTIHEAENAMRRIASSTVVNYYTISDPTPSKADPKAK
jgi:hypothetical protein